jgi:hypothetical protein
MAACLVSAPNLPYVSGLQLKIHNALRVAEAARRWQEEAAAV